jgi:hypothetical protein
MVSLIINKEGWMSLCDKNLDIRWGNVDGMGRYVDDESGIKAAYTKKANDRRSNDPVWHEYVALAYSPILEWPVEAVGEPPEGL